MPLGLAPQVIDVCGDVKRSGAIGSPPRRFRSATGVRSGWLSSQGPFGRTPTGNTHAQRAGLRYEKKAQQHIQKITGGGALLSQWIKYHDASGTHWCQPDALFLTPYGMAIFEMKVTFTARAWWQLRRLYEPVVQAIFGVPYTFPIVVCKNYDVAIPFPEVPHHYTLEEIVEFMRRPPETYQGQLGVVSWAP